MILLAREIIALTIGRGINGHAHEYAITEEYLDGYAVLGYYASLEDAKRDFRIMRSMPRYSHLPD